MAENRVVTNRHLEDQHLVFACRVVGDVGDQAVLFEEFVGGDEAGGGDAADCGGFRSFISPCRERLGWDGMGWDGLTCYGADDGLGHGLNIGRCLGGGGGGED